VCGRAKSGTSLQVDGAYLRLIGEMTYSRTARSWPSGDGSSVETRASNRDFGLAGHRHFTLGETPVLPS